MTVAEGEFEDTVSSDLGDRRHPPCLQVFSKAADEARGRRGGGSREVGQVASEARFDDELLLVVGLGELEEEDLGGEVIDIGDTQRHQGVVELVRNDLQRRETDGRTVSERRQEWLETEWLTLTSKDENRCFILVVSR